jgi:two-component system chemotaxis sensor kinase CheA
MSSDDFIEALRKEFLEEAGYLLEQCEEALLGLDDEARRPEQLANIFRAAHTVKGSGAAVGFEDLVGFAHRFEDCLALLRMSPQLLTTELTSLFLRVVDALKQRVQQLRQGGGAPWDPQELTAELTAATQALQAPALGLVKTPHEAAAFGFFDEAPPAQTRSTAPTPAGEAPRDGGGNSIRVDCQRIDSFMDIVGELVVVKSQLFNKVATYATDSGLQAIASLLDTIVRDLQDKALSIRMTPLKPLFLKLQRLVRDLSLKVDKPVTFAMVGEDTELDRTMVELLADPLMHMIRNSVDHGIEPPERRRAAGKSDTGLVTLLARQTGGRVVIEVRDDGGGLDRDRIVAKARERGLMSQDSDLSEREAYALIFQPGFSTAERVSDVSGRGVGMDVVKTNIERLKGTIEIESAPGKGTTFFVSLPLTTSITDGILVDVGGQPLVIPMDGVRDLVPIDQVIPFGKSGELIQVRGSILPMLDLSKLLTSKRPSRSAGPRQGRKMAVVVESAGRQQALVVETVVGQMQVVLKPLGAGLREVPGMAGAAILGDGRVALVIDLATLLSRTQPTKHRYDEAA